MRVSETNYMKDFQCIGPDCEATCCFGWEIGLCKKDVDNLKDLTQRHKDLKHLKKAFAKKKTADPNSGVLGALVLDKGMHCQFLDEGLCRIHRDYGEHYIPMVCATYPRVYYQLPQGTELHGKLSCPEVARLCLLNSEATRVEEPVEKDINSVFGVNRFLVQSKDFYHKLLPQVMQTIRFIWDCSDFSCNQKHYLCLYLARKCQSFYHRDIQQSPETRLNRVLGQFMDPIFLEKRAKNLESVAEMGPKVKNLMLTVLGASFEGLQFDRLNELLINAFEGAGVDRALFRIDQADEVQRLLDYFSSMRAHVLDRFGERVEYYFNHFSRNVWFQALYMGSKDLLTANKKLLISWFLIRFAFFSHKKTHMALESSQDEAAFGLLDEAMVESTHVMMRSIDANETIQDHVLHALDILEFNSLEDLASLIRV